MRVLKKPIFAEQWVINIFCWNTRQTKTFIFVVFPLRADAWPELLVGRETVDITRRVSATQHLENNCIFRGVFDAIRSVVRVHVSTTTSLTVWLTRDLLYSHQPTGDELALWHRLFIITFWPSVTRHVAIPTPETCSTRFDSLLRVLPTIQRHHQLSRNSCIVQLVSFVEWHRQHRLHRSRIKKESRSRGR